MKEAFIKELEDVPYYCLTADNWTDSSNQSYIGITIHYVNNSAMTGRVLGCFPLYENHTSEYLMKSIQNIFDDFKIKNDKVTAMITDGAPNIKKAGIDLLGKDKHLVCIAHVASHLLPDALNNFKEFNTIINKVKAIVTQKKRSIPASDKLKEMQLKDGKTEGTILKLKLDVPTRWTTKIEMLERYILLEPYIYNAINKCEKPLNLLTREEISIVKDILPIMEPIKTVITEISGDDYPTCSLIIPIINCMKQKICSTVSTTEVGELFKTKLQTAMANRFKNIEMCSLLAVSTLLDPRFKKIHFKDPCAVSSALARIRKEIETMKPVDPKPRPTAVNTVNSNSI
ncbi:zinc finger BED domain-containing protein 1-like isoform X1 [Nasonia vitripennis]|uniref:Uncharacterized protein n=1 Tax=Nasonia vitripennis TaxID=7425 RepID=A0A7M7PXT9_NASVI|nr:zinc finger BED domain-containing protein 1-like isoform X1 [Nasonia vitripennis]